MRGVALTLVVSALLLLAFAACESSDPRRTPCDAGLCESPPSIFNQEDPFARQIEGRVLQGTEIVAGANVAIEPSPGLAWDARLADASDVDAGDRSGYVTSTDLGGKYHVLNAPFFYDLTIRKGREVAVFREIGVRGFEPPLGEDAPVTGFTAHVAASTNPPAAAGNAVAFFVGGPEARTVSGEAGSLAVTFRHFESLFTLFAVEYVASSGLSKAVRAGRINIRVTNGGAVSAVVPLTAIHDVKDVNDITFFAEPPKGFALSTLDLVMDFGVRTSARTVARVAAGQLLHLAVVREARYFVRATAALNGATTDSGLFNFNPFKQNVALLLPPPVSEASFDGTNVLTAVADPAPGTVQRIVEHVLVPAAATGARLRIATFSRETTIPDLSRLGLPRPAGLYTWTVQQFPTLRRVDGLSGEDVRLVTPFSTTAPRSIELR